MSQLTERQYLFLDDLIHMEENQTILAADLAQRCQDPQIADLCLRIARESERHFNTLVQQLDRMRGRSSMGQSTMSQSTMTSPSPTNHGYFQSSGSPLTPSHTQSFNPGPSSGGTYQSFQNPSSQSTTGSTDFDQGRFPIRP